MYKVYITKEISKRMLEKHKHSTFCYQTKKKMQENLQEWSHDRWRSAADQWWRWECRCWCRCWCNWSWPLGRRRRWGRPGCGCRRYPVGCWAGTSACSRWCCGQTLSRSTRSLVQKGGGRRGGEQVNTLGDMNLRNTWQPSGLLRVKIFQILCQRV